MDETHTRAVGRADTGRAEAFSDGVFAIIITLLVLDLRPPAGEPGRLLSGLVQQWPTYLAYVTSYLYVAVVWLNHKGVFRRLRQIDLGLHWVNLGVLFTTALLPFATAVLSRTVEHGHAADVRTAVGLYALVGALLCVSWLAFFHYLSRHSDLAVEDVQTGFFPRERIRAWAGIALYVAAGTLGYLVAPAVALVIFLALPIFFGLTSEGLDAVPAVRRRHRSRPDRA
jgi:uncharacterized membrane protein